MNIIKVSSVSYKYKQIHDIDEWKQQVNNFLNKHYLKSEPVKDIEDMVISYDARGMTLAVWDMYDKEGWLITDEYFKNKGVVEQIIGKFSSGR
jgi:hypothetical protein